MNHLSLISHASDAELAQIHAAIHGGHTITDRMDVEAVFGRLAAAPGRPSPTTLDLIGHSTPGGSLLQLGRWVIDGANPVVTAFFRELADQELLARLGIEAIRLLGCNTADTGRGRATMRALAEITGVEVYGTSGLVFASHYAASGFKDEWKFLLVSSSELGAGLDRQASPTTASSRILDLDALPSRALATDPAAWPRLTATPEAARSLLRLVKRNEGAQMPGLLSQPSCEIAIPSAVHGRWHHLQLVLDGTFVRVYPDGDDRPGVLYPVTDPSELRALCYSLTQRTPAT